MDDFRPTGSSPVVAAYSNAFAEESRDLHFAYHVRQLLAAVDSSFTYHRVAAMTRLFQVIRALPAPRDHDPFTALGREGAAGRGGSAPSLVAHVLKRSFVQDSATSAPSPAANAAGVGNQLRAPSSWAEKELALRLCQGICILSPAQRRLADDSRLVDILVSCFDMLPVLADRSVAGGAPDGQASDQSEATSPPKNRQATLSMDSIAAPPDQAHAGLSALEVQARYRVALAAIDALEASTHYSPALLVKMIRRGVANKMVMCIADSRHPTVVRQSAADTLGAIAVQTLNPVEWQDRQSANAIANEIRSAFRGVLDARRQRDDHDPASEFTAQQLLDMLARLRDYRGAVAFKEVATVRRSATSLTTREAASDTNRLLVGNSKEVQALARKQQQQTRFDVLLAGTAVSGF